MSLAKWRKENQTWQVNYEFPPGHKKISKPVNYRLFSDSIRETGIFDPSYFHLPVLECAWLDFSNGMKLDFYMQDETGEFGLATGDLQAHHFGDKYPIKPILKREGLLYPTIQPQLIQRIIKKRTELILNSNKALSDDWVFDLRNLISDVISLVDIAFNQLYVKAEFDPLPGWNFNRDKLGERHGRRLNDKIKWVFQIAGNNLNIETERNSLESLRMLRNHLMHFDPPSLVITIEEAAIWLNQIIDIGKIIVKIRKAIGVDTSCDLLNFLLQKEAIFIPVEQSKRRPLIVGINENYASSTWAKSDE